MEIRDPIHGGIELEPAEAAVVESPFFQRLRRVKQLGYAELVFPGACHNRLLHSVGVMHLAGVAFDVALKDADWLPTGDRQRLRRILRLAALCHDVGHAPLSHASEVLFPTIGALDVPKLKGDDPTRQARHEHYTLKLMLDSQLSSLIRREYGPLGIEPEHAACLLHSGLAQGGAFDVAGRNLHGILAALTSGEVDVDRMDYLLRDSYYTGVKYGTFDHAWLLGHLAYHEGEDGNVHLAIEDRALYTFDDFLLSRYHMFLMVYFHYKVVCYDRMLRRFYDEYPGLIAVPSDPEKFLLYDDAAINNILSEHAHDSVWAYGITNVRPLELIAERWPHSQEDPVEAVRDRLTAHGIDHLTVTSKGALSKYGGRADSARTIYVRIQPRVGASRFITLGEATKLFERYAEAALLERVYVHAEDAELAGSWVQELRAASTGSNTAADTRSNENA
jgi:uncharacterized protein